PHRVVTAGDEDVALARRQILGTREHSLDARGRRAGEHGIEVLGEAPVVEMRVCVDHARRVRPSSLARALGRATARSGSSFPAAADPSARPPPIWLTPGTPRRAPR